MMKERTLEPVLDFVCCGMERMTLPSASSAGGVPREELELIGSACEAQELDREMLDGARRRMLLEARMKRCGNTAAVSRRIFEGDLSQP